MSKMMQQLGLEELTPVNSTQTKLPRLAYNKDKEVG